MKGEQKGDLIPVFFVFKYFWAVFLGIGLLNAFIYKVRSLKHIKEKPELEEGYNRLILGYAFWMSLPWLIMGAGILSNHVSQIFDYFRPRDGNPYVLAFFACVILEWVLLLYWIFFLEGAEKLSRYEGLLNRPLNNPILIKVFTVICVMGGVVAFTMMWVVSIPSPNFPN